MLTLFQALTDTVRILASNSYSNKFILKGGTALASKLIENGLPQLVRQTKDIDIHCKDKTYWLFFSSHIENILNDNNSGYFYKVKRHRGLDKTGFSDSFQLEVRNGSFSTIIGIDMNLKDVDYPSVYLPSLSIYAYDNYVMLSDKLSVINSRTIFRRCKDMYDICTLASIEDYNMAHLTEVIKHKNLKYRDMEFMLTQKNYRDLEHAFSKFQGIQLNITFKEIFMLCYNFNLPVYRCISSDEGGGLVWNRQIKQWGLYR